MVMAVTDQHGGIEVSCFPQKSMFFATAGRGTESFLASEIDNKINNADACARDGKVFFSKLNVSREDINKILTLRAAERVFAAIVDCDNSKLVHAGKRAFLDKFMGQMSQRHIYAGADAVIKLTKETSCYQGFDNQRLKRSSDQSSDVIPESYASSSAEDQAELSEPDSKCARLDASCSQCDRLRSSQPPVKTSVQGSESPSDSALTFRMSIKCSGKLRKRLDIKRLSHDVAWRVAQASGWRTQLRQPDLEVCVHISDEHVTVGIPLTRLPLSRRDYIQDSGLRAPVAWIMCKLAEIENGDVVLDPMCGKSTILLEGASCWKDAFYLGSDRSSSQIQAAVQNVTQSKLGNTLDLSISNGLNMPFRKCSVDAVICDAPFNQNHLTLEAPTSFYKRFLQEIHGVLKPGGRCVLLVSQELVAVILTFVLPSPGDSGNDMREENPADKAELIQGSTESSVTKSDHVETILRNTPKEESGSSLASGYCPEVCTSDAHSDNTKQRSTSECDRETSIISGRCFGSQENLKASSLFTLVSQHPVKLGETLACILKLIKR